MAKSLTGFIKMLEEKHPETILHVKEQLDPNQHELAAFIKLLEEKDRNPVVIFENVKNLKGDKSMLLYGVLQSHQTKTYDQAVKVMDALVDIEPNEPMAYIEDVNKHYQWPDNW